MIFRKTIDISAILFSIFVFGACSNVRDEAYCKQLIDNGQYDSAIAIADRHLKDDSNALKYLECKAFAETKLQHYDSARATLSNILSHGPDNADILNGYGDVLYKIGLPDSAYHYFMRAFELDSGTRNLNYNLAVLFFEYYAKDSIALNYIERELRLQPDDNDARLLQANILLESDNIDKAETIASEILKSGKNRANAFEIAGIACFRRQDYHCAVEKFSKAIQHDDKISKYYIRRASALALLKQYDDALLDCDKAISLDPNNTDAYVITIHIYDITDDKSKLCADLVKLRMLDPKKSTLGIYQNVDCR